MKQFKFYGCLLLTSALIGGFSYIFLQSLSIVGSIRDQIPYLVFGLPIIGVLTAFVYKRYGKDSKLGNNLLLDNLYEDVSVPKRMGVLTYVFTLLTHLVGGSAGREGTALQVGGVMMHNISKRFDFTKEERDTLLIAAISAAFGSVFGIPFAGAIFALEFRYIGAFQHKALVSAFLASYTANAVALLCGAVHNMPRDVVVPTYSLYEIFVVVIAGVLFAVFAHLFISGIAYTKKILACISSNIYMQALLGSSVLLLVILLFQLQRFEGLSTWMMQDSFLGNLGFLDVFEKLFLTIVTLGSGFQGGEVTPLFDLGAAIGSSVSMYSGVSAVMLAGLGIVAMFGNTANTPLCIVAMGLELFGVGYLPYLILVMCVGQLLMKKRSMYGHRRIKKDAS